MAREKLFGACPNTSASGEQCDWKLCNASASEAAERFVDLSAFVYRGYCTSTIMLDVPISKSMKHLSNRLYAYAFGLVIGKTPEFSTRPGQRTTLTMSTAVESMRQLAEFLEKKANDLIACGLSSETELALAADLHSAKQYTDELLKTEPGSRTHTKRPPTIMEEVATVNTLTERARPKSEKACGKARATEYGTCCTGVSLAERSAAQQLRDDAPQTRNAEQGQSNPLMRFNGPSAMQLRAQINILQRQLADLQIRPSSKPGASAYNSPQIFNMPTSPLHSSPSYLQGPHDSCNCGATPAANGTPLSAMYKLAKGARMISTLEEQETAHWHASTTTLNSRPEADRSAKKDERISGWSSPPQNDMAEDGTCNPETSRRSPDLFCASSLSESASSAQTP